MRFLFSIVFFLFFLLSSTAQEKTIDFDTPDSLYREDQFYFGLTYNKLQNTPYALSQNKFSAGLSFGFLRDMPINKARTWSVATGLGYAYNSFNHDLFISQSNSGSSDEISYNFDSNLSYRKNKSMFHYVDVPLEIRWRTSTPESHQFWRVYTGVKFSYLFYDKYRFEGDGRSVKITGNNDLNKFQYGVYLATGWNTWNFYAYYGLNPIFKNAKVDGDKIEMRSLNFGLMFYIL